MQQRACQKVDEDFFLNVDKSYYTNFIYPKLVYESFDDNFAKMQLPKTTDIKVGKESIAANESGYNQHRALVRKRLLK